jgi:hypothetical protein
MAPELRINDIDRRFRYRVGWPRLINAPVETAWLSLGPADLRDGLPGVDMEQLAGQVRQILDRHHIVPQSSNFARFQYRTPLQGWTNPPREHLRLTVECDYDPRQQEEFPDSWAQAVIEIYDLVRQTTNHLLLKIGIELFDPSYEGSIRLTQVPDTHQHIIANWDGGLHYRQQVLRLFENQPRLWQAMVLVGLCASNKHTRDYKCVLWFDAIDTTHTLWPQMETELREILPQDISIEIWQARNRLLCTTFDGGEGESIRNDSSGIEPSKILVDVHPRFLEQPPNPGCSIGVVGEETGTGTLGGYVKVLEPTVDADGNSTQCERVYALTCAHVALGGSPLFKLLKSKGRVHYGKDDSLLMQSPSVEDCTKFREDTKSKIANHESEIRDFDNEMHLHQSVNNIRAAQNFRRLKDVAEGDLAVSRRNFERLSEDHCLGSVRAAAFGECAHRNTEFRKPLAMDIALIDVSELEVDLKACRFGGIWPFGIRHGLFDTWEPFNWSRRMIVNEKVAKIGRTSGVNTGFLNRIKGDFNISLGEGSGVSTTVYVVHTASKSKNFSLPGDSGSFVFAQAYSKVGEQIEQHRVIGLLIGSTLNGDFGYFIPFDAVIAEIEALTGGKVIWPVRCD